MQDTWLGTWQQLRKVTATTLTLPNAELKCSATVHVLIEDQWHITVTLLHIADPVSCTGGDSD